MATKRLTKNSDEALTKEWFKNRAWADRIQQTFDRGAACQHNLAIYELNFSDMNEGKVPVANASLRWCPECGGTPISEALKTLKQILNCSIEGNVRSIDINNSAYSFCDALAGSAQASLIISGPGLDWKTSTGMHFLPRPETKEYPKVVMTGWFGMALESEAEALLREKKAWSKA